MARPPLLLLLLPVVSPAPHVVVILADDLGYHDVPWHNQRYLVCCLVPVSSILRRLVAPNLQGLSERGIRLEQHYSHSTCSPSRAALLTGPPSSSSSNALQICKCKAELYNIVCIKTAQGVTQSTLVCTQGLCRTWCPRCSPWAPVLKCPSGPPSGDPLGAPQCQP